MRADRIAAEMESVAPAETRGKRLGGGRKNMLQLADTVVGRGVANATGAAFSVFLYYLPLLAAGSAFVQQVLSVPFWNGSFATHIMRKCSHFVACLFVCSSSWLSISKFHYSMFNDGAWREDSCSSENGGALGVEFLLHLSSAFMYFCMSSSNWLPLAATSDSQNHDHDE